MKSLILDQVANLEKKNIKSDAFFGDISIRTRREILNNMISENYDRNIIYTTPETLDNNDEFVNNLVLLKEASRINRFVIDEAHCISLWEMILGIVIESWHRSNIRFLIFLLALTATATPRVRTDTVHLLNLKDVKIYTKSYFRPNLKIFVNQRNKDTFTDIVEKIKNNYDGQVGIIYCLSRKNVKRWLKNFNNMG